jgi:hypothetical protein
VLTPEQRADFERHGFARVPSAFSRDDAGRMEDTLWNSLEQKHGVVRTDRATWKLPLAVGLQSLRGNTVFEPIGGARTVDAIDSLMGAGGWHQPKHWGQFLVSFPEPGEKWSVTHRSWHTDFPYFLHTDRIYGLLVFAFIGEVPAGTGGTIVVSGSPRVVSEYIGAHPKLRKTKMKVTRRALMQSDPWLRELASESGPADRSARFMQNEARIDDNPVRVVELTGEPGDVILGHPWLLHSASPNCGDRPRFMSVQRISASR